MVTVKFSIVSMQDSMQINSKLTANIINSLSVS